jgi:hypothetical protein
VPIPRSRGGRPVSIAAAGIVLIVVILMIVAVVR